MNKRIIAIRNAFGLNQSEFGKRLGVSRDVISNIELNRVEAKEPFIKLLCKEFHVDYIWLTTGQGEMFVNQSFEDMAIVNRITDTILNNESEFAKNVFKMFSQYTLEDWKALEHVVSKSKEYMEQIKKED